MRFTTFTILRYNVFLTITYFFFKFFFMIFGRDFEESPVYRGFEIGRHWTRRGVGSQIGKNIARHLWMPP